MNTNNISQNNKQYIYEHLRKKRNDFQQSKFNEQETIQKQSFTKRPAQAVSFGGSVVSEDKNKKESKSKEYFKRAALVGGLAAAGGLTAAKIAQKRGFDFVTNSKINNFVNFVYENEAAYNAIYSLVIAGVLKPIFVMMMPGSEEKDKQSIATKNFLQAFIGSFLGLTVGGGIIKKSYDVLKTNLSLIKFTAEKYSDDKGINRFKNITLIPGAIDDKKTIAAAKKALIQEKTGFDAKLSKAKEAYANNSGFKKITEFISTLRKDIDYKPTQEEILEKSKNIIKELEEIHLPIFKKNPEFVAKLLESAKNINADCTLMDAFEALWKNSSGALTAIAKAKISSFLLPSVMAFLFAKKNEKIEQEKINNAGTVLLRNNKQLQENVDKIVEKNKLNTNQLNFTGNYTNRIIKAIGKGIEKLSMTKFSEKFSNFLLSLPGPLKKPSARMSDIESFGLTGYWWWTTNNSKKIDNSQKLGLNVHTILVTIISSLCAFLIDTVSDGAIVKQAKKYADIIEKAVKALPEDLKLNKNEKEIKAMLEESCKNLLGKKEIVKTLSAIDLNNQKDVSDAIRKLEKTYSKKLSKFKSLTIFTLVVRFLVPVLTVPFSGKLKKAIIAWTNKNKNDQENKETAKAA